MYIFPAINFAVRLKPQERRRKKNDYFSILSGSEPNSTFVQNTNITSKIIIIFFFKYNVRRVTFLFVCYFLFYI